MNAKTIAWLLAVRNASPFFARRHLAVVPNVSWGLLPWEADLVVLTKTRYLYEIEIKVSMSDWKADADKTKFRTDCYASAHRMIRKFWYAAPEKLAARYTELQLPAHAGVISVTDGKIKVLKPAATITSTRKIRYDEVFKILRLGALKAWRLAYHPDDSDVVPEEGESDDGDKISATNIHGNREPDERV